MQLKGEIYYRSSNQRIVFFWCFPAPAKFPGVDCRVRATAFNTLNYVIRGKGFYNTYVIDFYPCSQAYRITFFYALKHKGDQFRI